MQLSRFLAVIFGVISAASPAALGQTIYQTGFDSAPFVNGNLLGQDNWTSTDNPATPNRAVVQSSTSLSAPRAVLIDASVAIETDWFWKPLNFPISVGTAPLVQIQWDMFIDSSDATQSNMWGVDVYDTSSPVQRRVSSAVIGSTGTVLVWDGNSFFNTSSPASVNAWHHFKMNLDYVNLKATVFMDGLRVAYAQAFSPSVNTGLGDADFLNLVNTGTDSAFFDNLSIVALPDGDHDGIPNSEDGCLATPPGDAVTPNGCSTLDQDGDGVTNDLDQCPNTPTCATVNASGCPSDTDGDGFLNGCDNCNSVSNVSQLDSDGDGEGDACDICPNRKPGDTNGDGLVNGLDISRFVYVFRGGIAPADDRCACDIDEDGSVLSSDIPGFTQRLLNP